MRSIGHFIGGKEVKGTSGRTADVFEPMTGDVQAKVALASKAELRAAVENAKAAQPEWANTNPQRRVRVMMKFLELVRATMTARPNCWPANTAKPFPTRRAIFCAVSKWWNLPRHSAYDEGRIHRRRRPRHRHLFDAATARRRRRHHAVQFPGDDPDVEVRARDRLRQRLHPQTVGARSRRADDAGRADDRGGAAARHPQCRQRRQGSGRRHPRRSRYQRRRFCRLFADRAIHLRACGGYRQALPVFWRRQEPRHHHAGCRHGPDRRCAGRRRIRRGRRALHGGVGGGARRQDHGRPIDGKADSARRES